MKKCLIFSALLACCIMLVGCPASLDKEVNKVIFAHYVEDSLSLYVYADTTYHTLWRSGFTDTVCGNVKKWSYPGTWAYPLIPVDKIQNSDFLYKCNHDLYVGYPNNFGITTGVGCIYNVKWEDAAKFNYDEAIIIERQPLDYYIKVDIDKINKYARIKNISSGDQLRDIVNRMMEDGSFIESIDLIGSQRTIYCFGKVEDYCQYVRDYRRGLVEYRFPIIDWLVAE